MRQFSGVSWRSMLLVLAVISALVGCGGSDGSGDVGDEGGSDPRADRLIRQAIGYVERVDAVRLSSKGTVEGAPTEIVLQYVGSDMAGSATIRGGSVKFRVIDGVAFSKADETFMRDRYGDEAAEFISTVGGRWLRTSDGDGFLPVAQWGNKDEFVKEAITPVGGGLYVDGTKNIGGVACFRLRGTNTEFFVSTGDGRPILLIQDSGRTTFSYEPATLPGAPPKNRVVDVKDLAPNGGA